MASKNVILYYSDNEPWFCEWLSVLQKNLDLFCRSYLSGSLTFHTKEFEPENPVDEHVLIAHSKESLSLARDHSFAYIIAPEPVDNSSNIEINAVFGIDDFDGETPNAQYWQALADLAYLFSGTQSKNATSVYLGAAYASMQNNKNLVCHELIQKRIGVNIPKLTQFSPQSITEEIRKSLQGCALAVVFIGVDNEPLVEGSSVGVSEFQYGILQEYAKECDHPFTILLWFDNFAIFQQKNKLQYLQRMLNAAEESVQTEAVQLPISKFKELLFKRLTSTKNQSFAVHNSKPDKLHAWYVAGISSVPDIKATLQNMEDKGSALFFTEMEDPEKMLEKHFEALHISDQIIICTENKSTYWLVSMLQDILKSLGHGREKMFDRVVVLLSGREAEFEKAVEPYTTLLPITLLNDNQPSELANILKNK